jgi:hypothetical protein
MRRELPRRANQWLGELQLLGDEQSPSQSHQRGELNTCLYYLLVALLQPLVTHQPLGAALSPPHFHSPRYARGCSRARWLQDLSGDVSSVAVAAFIPAAAYTDHDAVTNGAARCRFPLSVVGVGSSPGSFADRIAVTLALAAVCAITKSTAGAVAVAGSQC